MLNTMDCQGYYPIRKREEDGEEKVEGLAFGEPGNPPAQAREEGCNLLECTGAPPLTPAWGLKKRHLS